jgi:hypothetical protein
MSNDCQLERGQAALPNLNWLSLSCELKAENLWNLVKPLYAAYFFGRIE